MIEKLFYLYIILLPLMNLPKFNFMGAKIQYADLVFIPLALMFVCKVIWRKEKLIKNIIDLLFIILAFFSFLSFLHSPVRNKITQDFSGLIYLILVYFVFTRFAAGHTAFHKLNFVLFITTLFMSICGILFFVLYNFFNMEVLSRFFYTRAFGSQSSFVPFSRVSSFLTLPEMFINFVLLGLCSAFVCRCSLLPGQRTKKIFIDFSISVIILSVFMAFSRSLNGVMLFLLMILFYFGGRSFFMYLLRTVCLSGFVLMAVSTLVTWIFIVYPVSFSVDNSSKMATLTFNTAFYTRIYLAKAALVIGKEYPVLGMGLGSYTNNFRKFLSGDDISRLSLIRKTKPEALQIDPHSLYFGTLAELGYSGLSILLLIFIFILYRLRKASNSVSFNPQLKNYCVICFSALAGFLVNGLFVDILSMRSFWLVLSMSVIIINLKREAEYKI